MTAEQPKDFQIGRVHLNVSHMERATFFFREALGFKLLAEDETRTSLGCSPDIELLILHQVNNPPPRKATTGLYHLALLLPTREDLARLILHLVNNNVPLQGVADHGVSESVYLSGPDDIGIEIYADRNLEDWPCDEEGQLEMGTDELDLDNLLLTIKGKNKQWNGLPVQTRVGHVHLKVSELTQTALFYKTLGLQVTQEYGQNALFFAGKDYHHHVAVNTWDSAGADPLPVDTAGLRSFEIVLADQSSLSAIKENLTRNEISYEDGETNILVRDPNGILIELLTKPGLK